MFATGYKRRSVHWGNSTWTYTSTSIPLKATGHLSHIVSNVTSASHFYRVLSMHVVLKRVGPKCLQWIHASSYPYVDIWFYFNSTQKEQFFLRAPVDQSKSLSLNIKAVVKYLKVKEKKACFTSSLQYLYFLYTEIKVFANRYIYSVKKVCQSLLV